MANGILPVLLLFFSYLGGEYFLPIVRALYPFLTDVVGDHCFLRPHFGSFCLILLQV